MCKYCTFLLQNMCPSTLLNSLYFKTSIIQSSVIRLHLVLISFVVSAINEQYKEMKIRKEGIWEHSINIHPSIAICMLNSLMYMLLVQSFRKLELMILCCNSEAGNISNK
jgi:hypothetical protein